MQMRNRPAHERACSRRLEECPAKCGLKIAVCDFPVHLASDCMNRFVDCPFDCGMKVCACWGMVVTFAIFLSNTPDISLTASQSQ